MDGSSPEYYETPGVSRDAKTADNERPPAASQGHTAEKRTTHEKALGVVCPGAFFVWFAVFFCTDHVLVFRAECKALSCRKPIGGVLLWQRIAALSQRG